MKRLFLLTAALVLAVAVLPLLAQTEIEQVPITWRQAALSDGGALYAELCASCHGVGGKGDGPAAPALSAKLPDLTRLAALNDGEFPADQVQRAITGATRITAHGSPEMPVWGAVFESVRPDRKPVERWTFSQTRVYNLTEHLRTLQAE